MAFANPGFHYLRIGEIEVFALNDAMFQASTEVLVGVAGKAADTMLTEAFRPLPPRITVSAFLLRAAGRTVLIDTGGGVLMGEAGGRLPTRLAAIGVAPAAIDTVLLTHLHIDHVGGLSDADGHAAFANAELVLPSGEASFWLDEGRAAQAPEPMRPAFGIAQTALAPYRERMRMLDGGEAAAGVTMEPLPGHSPGHSGYLVASGGEQLLIWGDIVHLPGLQFAHPEIGVMFDYDAADAQATRRRVLDRAATDRLMVAGMHHDFPCFGHVARHGAAYAFVPGVWTP